MNACYTFDLRANQANFKVGEIKEFFQKNCKKWAFQLEKGEQTGYMHWQARVSLRKKKYASAAKKWLLEVGWNYVEPTSSPAAIKGNMFYVLKDDTREDGPWTDKDIEKFIPFQNAGTCRPWQQKVLDSADTRDSRTINVLIDPQGNKGKSWLVGRAICEGYPLIPSCGDAQLLIATVCDILTATQNRDPKLMLIDLPRSLNKSRMQSMFHAIEVIKNGHVYDMRYSYKQWSYHSPQIWIMTNEDINTDYMSNDRWKIWSFSGEDIVRQNMPNMPIG